MKRHLGRLLAVSVALPFLLSITSLPWDESPTRGIKTVSAQSGGSGGGAGGRAGQGWRPR